MFLPHTALADFYKDLGYEMMVCHEKLQYDKKQNFLFWRYLLAQNMHTQLQLQALISKADDNKRAKYYLVNIYRNLGQLPNFNLWIDIMI